MDPGTIGFNTGEPQIQLYFPARPRLCGGDSYSSPLQTGVL